LLLLLLLLLVVVVVVVVVRGVPRLAGVRAASWAQVAARLAVPAIWAPAGMSGHVP
jgi:hypothetical protein